MNNVVKCMVCTKKCHLIRWQFLFASNTKYCLLLFDRILVTFSISFYFIVCFQNEWLQDVCTRNYRLHKRCFKRKPTNNVCILKYCAIETMASMCQFYDDNTESTEIATMEKAIETRWDAIEMETFMYEASVWNGNV